MNKGDNGKTIERLENHIKALEKGYDNIIEILNEDIEKKKDKDGNQLEEIALKDDKIKIYVDGIGKASENADALLARIRTKEEELFKLKNPEKEKTPKNTDEGDSNLNKRLR